MPRPSSSADRLGRRVRTGGLVFSLALASLLGCSSGPARPDPLDEEETRLLEEVLGLMEVRIERARDPEGARERRDALGTLYTDAEVQALLDRLSADPRRAHLFVEALSESLEARRKRLFPPTEVELNGEGTARP